jgi:hypothetical protein
MTSLVRMTNNNGARMSEVTIFFVQTKITKFYSNDKTLKYVHKRPPILSCLLTYLFDQVFYLSIFLSVYLSLFLSFSLSLFLSSCLPVFLFLSFYILAFVHLFICLFLILYLFNSHSTNNI